MFVSVVVPAYKQEKSIKKNLQNIYSTMSKTRHKFEIVVVVDGFVDRTFEKAKEVLKPGIRVVGYPQNKGKGYAVRYGMAKARGDIIAFIDAGMEIDANNISMILEHMQWYKADIIIGSKRHPASKVSYPLVRRIYSIGYQLLVFLLFNLKVKDTQTGLKVFRRKVLEDALPRLVVKQYAFDVELLAVARHLGYKRIYEAPVEIAWNFNETRIKGLFLLDPFIRRMLIDTFAVFYRLRVQGYYDNTNRKRWRKDREVLLFKGKSQKWNRRSQ